MTYLQDVTHSKDLVGTYSSGASQTTYGQPWKDQDRKEFDAHFRLTPPAIVVYYPDLTTSLDASHILQQRKTVANIGMIEPHYLADTATRLGLDSVFQWRRFTSANTELEEPYKTIIQFWQRLEISERFAILAQREDNWDGYDSKKPTELTLDHAKYLIAGLFDYIVSLGHSWLNPFISSDEDGNVTVEWSQERRRLHIQIAENEAEYIQVWGTNIDTEMHVDFLSPDDYLMLWEWLIDG